MENFIFCAVLHFKSNISRAKILKQDQLLEHLSVKMNSPKNIFIFIYKTSFFSSEGWLIKARLTFCLNRLSKTNLSRNVQGKSQSVNQMFLKYNQ